MPRSLFNLLCLLLLISPILSYAGEIEGKLLNNNTTRSVAKVRIIVRILNAADEPTGQYFEEVTNEYGEFRFNIPCRLPTRLRFEVKEKNFHCKVVTRVQPGRRVDVKVTDDAEVVTNRLIILKDQMAREHLKIKDQLIPSELAENRDTKLIHKLQDSLDFLAQKVENMISQLNKGEIATMKATALAEELVRTNKRLQDEVVRLQGQIKVLEGDVWQAYTKFTDVHCQGISADHKTLSFSFKVIDRNRYPVLNRKIAIKVVIEKLESVKKEEKSTPIMHECGRTYLSTVVEPTPYVTVSFTARDDAFNSNKPNYTIKVYNTLFDDEDKPFINEELWRLNKNCFEQTAEDPVLLIDGKKNVFVQTIELAGEQATLELKDYSVVDNDIITLLLNGEPVLTDITLKGRFESFPLTLRKGQNTLTLKTVSSGSNGPNTCLFRISDSKQTISGKLSETPTNTESVKIICK